MNAASRKGGATWVALAAFLIGVFLAADAFFPPPLSRALDLSSVVEARDGTPLRLFLAKDGILRLKADSREVDARFLNMLKAYEDRRFDYHFGIDPLAVLRATGQLARNGKAVSGASTLTMQTARLLAPGHRGIGAKLVQSFRALQLESRFSKREILSLYLTLAPYGGNLEGVRAASLAYFGKEPARLTLAEAALLVALPQAPESQRPDRFAARARDGRNKVLSRLAAQGVIARQDAKEAIAEAVADKRRPTPFLAPHLAERLARGRKPGNVIVTTIDADLQSATEQLARREAQWFDDDANVAFLVIDNKTRAVLAHVANVNYWGPFGYLDLTRAVRSPGSTLKPFIYGLAFDDLTAHPETLTDDQPTVFGDYAPRNFDRGYQGRVSLRTALGLSLNVPAVALLDRIGPARFAARIAQTGARLYFPANIAAPALPLALGGVGITLEHLAALFTGLAHDGTVAPLRYTPGAPQTGGRAMFGATAAYYVRDILEGSPLPDGFAMAKGMRSRPIAFKTGTSFGFRDAWAMGVSRDYTVGVWVGRPDGSTRPGRFARNAAAPLMLRLFSLLPREAGGALPPPPDALVVHSYADLPRSLQYLAPGERRIPLETAAPRLAIAFPPDGAIVNLPAATDKIALRAEGARGSLYWLVNGEPLPTATQTGQRIFWRPDGEGFARISVVDQTGAKASSTVRLKRDPQ